MRSLALPMVLAGLVSACVDEPRPSEPSASASAPAAAPQSAFTSAAAPVSLAGAWRVAGVDGAEPPAPYGIALEADAREIWAPPRCRDHSRAYRIDGARFAVAGPPRGGPRPGRPCPPDAPPELAEVFRALDTATAITRNPENGLLISGGGHSLLLFSQ